MQKINPRTKTLLYIVYALVVIITIIPILWVVLASFKQPAEIFAYPPRFIPKHFTLENYHYVLTFTKVPKWLFNSIVVALASTIVALVLATTGAYGFSRFNFKGKAVLLLAILGTQMIPGVTNIIPLYLIMSKVHLTDTILALVLVYSAMRVPFSIWVMKGFFDTVPTSLDESARIDGCSWFQAFIRVVAPITAPGLVATVIFNAISAWNEFIIALVLTSSDKSQPLSVGLFAFQTQYGSDWQYIAASAVIGAVPVLIVFLALQQYFVAGLARGAVKG
ncbi:MAG: carbohydrate ABC transporter permease [Chloroflexota bacterium]